MKRKAFIWSLAAWLVITFVNYYYMPYFLIFLEYLIIIFSLLILTIVLIVRLAQNRQRTLRQTTILISAIFTLFLITFFTEPVNSLIEKADWKILYNTRMEIVEDVKQEKLRPNVSRNGVVCELPYEFPVVSNGGNDILISKNDSTNEVTVTFWVFRNFFSAPSTHLIYTNRPEDIDHYSKLIERDPINNWKIEENWFRTFTE